MRARIYPKWGTFLVYFILNTTAAYAFLDFDELSSIDYRFTLSDEPVVVSEQQTSAVQMTSIHGQNYQCSFPQLGESRQSERASEQAAEAAGVSELLRPMAAAPCLRYTKGWWTYEFCHNKNVRQFREEGGAVHGAVISLGVYESEFDWSNASEARINSLNRYHSQQYVNGTLCDLTGKPRRAEVRFMCDEGKGDHIARIDEPESCAYILTVHTTRICHHPYLKPAAKSRPVPITCSPALTQVEFAEYEAEMAAQRRAKAEAVRRYKEKIDAEAQKLKEKTADGEKAEGRVKKLMSETLKTRLQDKLHSGGVQAEVAVKFVEDADDIEATVREMMQEQQRAIKRRLEELTEDGQTGKEKRRLLIDKLRQKLIHKNAESVTEKSEDRPPASTGDTERKATTVIQVNAATGDIKAGRRQGDIMENSDAAKSPVDEPVVDNEVVMEHGDDAESQSSSKVSAAEEGIVGSGGPPGVAYIYSDIEDVMDEDDEDFVDVEEDEEEQELLEEFGEGYKKIAPTQAQKERIAKYKDNINSAMQSEFSTIVAEARQEAGVAADDDGDAALFRDLESMLGKILEQLDDAGVTETDGDGGQQDEQTAQENEAVMDGTAQTSTEEEGTAEKSTEEAAEGKSFEKSEDSPSGPHVWSSAADPGHKMEVRIVTVQNDEDGNVVFLSSDDSDTEAVNWMMAVVGSNEAEIREAQRQQRMQQAYSFRFKGSGKHMAVEDGDSLQDSANQSEETPANQEPDSAANQNAESLPAEQQEANVNM